MSRHIPYAGSKQDGRKHVCGCGSVSGNSKLCGEPCGKYVAWKLLKRVSVGSDIVTLFVNERPTPRSLFACDKVCTIPSILFVFVVDRRGHLPIFFSIAQLKERTEFPSFNQLSGIAFKSDAQRLDQRYVHLEYGSVSLPLMCALGPFNPPLTRIVN